MGQALRKALVWSEKGKLLHVPQNNETLHLIIDFCTRHLELNPEEFRHVFLRPLTWTTGLSAGDLLIRGGGGFIRDGDDVISEERCDDHSALHLDTGRSEVSVWRMCEVSRVLVIAEDNRQLQETWACLEANPDPLALIFGEQFSTRGQDLDLKAAIRVVEQSLKNKSPSEEESSRAELEEVDISEEVEGMTAAGFRLLILLQRLDRMMLSDVIKSHADKLTPQKVSSWVREIQDGCGDDPECHLLHYLVYTTTQNNVDERPQEYVGGDGYRAPFWRQLYGDICYLRAKPLDSSEIYIVANVGGVWRVKGLERADFEQISPTYANPFACLADQSEQFARNMENYTFHSLSADSLSNIRRMVSEKPPTKVGKGKQKRRRKRGKRKDVDKEEEASRSESREGPVKGELRTQNLWGRVGSIVGSDNGSVGRSAGSGWRLGEKGEEGKAEAKRKGTKGKGRGSPTKSKAVSGSRMSSSPQRARSRSPTKSPRHLHFLEKPVEEWSSSSSESEVEEDEDEDEVGDRSDELATELPNDYWQIQKLVKYIKNGNPTCTALALVCIRDFDLQQDACRMAVRDMRGLEVLLNLLETGHVRCMIGSLKILKEISTNKQIRKSIVSLSGLQSLVRLIDHANRDIKCLTSETISVVVKSRHAGRIVRKNGGIGKLVKLLSCGPLEMLAPGSSMRSSRGGAGLSAKQTELLQVARCAAQALCSCSHSARNKLAMKHEGIIPLLAQLLASSSSGVHSEHEALLIPVVGILHECAEQPEYREAIRREKMVEPLVRNLRSNNHHLQAHCASAIFKCAEDQLTRDLVRRHGGLEPLVALLKHNKNTQLLAAATGAIWKCALSEENMVRFDELDTAGQLVTLLTNQPEPVLINVCGALAQLCKQPDNRATMRSMQGIEPLVHLLTSTNQALLVNVTCCIGECARDADNMTIIDSLDGVRLLWSLLKNPSVQVQASAAWALCPCIENAKDAGDMVRSFVGGLELIVNLLKVEDTNVLASVCAALARIARDENNLAVITDHGVVARLAALSAVAPANLVLMRHLPEAIACCCRWRNNRLAFGEQRAVAPLVKFLGCEDAVVRRNTALALFELSWCAENMVAMHACGAVKPLIHMIGSHDQQLQVSAAGCVQNMRLLALANQRAKE